MIADLFDFDAVPVLSTERLILRGISPARDLAALFDLFADPDVARYTDTGPFSNIEEAVEVMDWVEATFAERRGLRWAITLRADSDRLIGTCGYNSWNRRSNSAEIGYDLMQPHWGRGIMTEALGAMVAFGFERMALNRIEADVTVGNEASARVLAKLGFSEEGLLRQRGHWRGEYHDLRIFGLLRSDWSS